MYEDYLKDYSLITQNFPTPTRYGSPEEQGAAIVKCSILESTDIQYCNHTEEVHIDN